VAGIKTAPPSHVLGPLQVVPSCEACGRGVRVVACLYCGEPVPVASPDSDPLYCNHKCRHEAEFVGRRLAAMVAGV